MPTDRLLDGWMEGRADRQTVRRVDGGTCRRTDCYTGGWADRLSDGRMARRMDGRMDFYRRLNTLGLRWLNGGAEERVGGCDEGASVYRREDGWDGVRECRPVCESRAGRCVSHV